MLKPITPKVKEAVQKATEIVLEETKEVDVSRIIYILESEDIKYEINRCSKKSR